MGGFEIVKDIEAGHGTDYRLFLGFGEFALLTANYNDSYWCDSGRFGFAKLELRFAIPIIAEPFEFWLKISAWGQFAITSLYENLAGAKIAVLIFL